MFMPSLASDRLKDKEEKLPLINLEELREIKDEE